MEAQVRELVTSGLVERWGFNDLSRNPDLKDISKHYADGELFVALKGNILVGVGAIIDESDGIGRIVRMSVSRELRGLGIGKAILRHLEEIAKIRGYHTIVLETTDTWDDAIGFYKSQGYAITNHADGDAHFIKQLATL